MTIFSPTATQDSMGVALIAGPCAIIRELTDAEVDIAEVGMMYEIEMSNGQRTSAFADELTEV